MLPLLKARFFSAKYLLRKVEPKDKITGPRIKATIPRTANPGTKTDANQKHKPLIINENAPRVKKLRGKDRVERAGFTDALINPIANPAIKAEGKLARLTPGTTMSTINRLKAVTNAVNKVPTIFFPPVSIVLLSSAIH
jgi:hypothetical protein